MIEEKLARIGPVNMYALELPGVLPTIPFIRVKAEDVLGGTPRTIARLLKKGIEHFDPAQV